MRLKKLIK
ncbi:Major fimbrial subunit precursor, partial [Haemophilus influenzae]